MTSQENTSDLRHDAPDLDPAANRIVDKVAIDKREGPFSPNIRKTEKTMTAKESADATRWVDFYHHRHQRWGGMVLSTIGILAAVGFLVALFIVEAGQSGAIIDLVKMMVNSYVGAALLIALVLRPLLGVLAAMWKHKHRQSNS